MIPPVMRACAARVLIAAIVVVLSPAVLAEELSTDAQATILLRVLTYDRHIERSSAPTLVVGIVFDPHIEGSKAAATRILASLDQLSENVRVGAKKIKGVHIPYTNREVFAASLGVEKPQALYLCPGLDAHLEHLTLSAREHSILTTTSIESYVLKGVAVGFTPRQNKARLLINLAAARAQGAELDPAVLSLAEIVAQ